MVQYTETQIRIGFWQGVNLGGGMVLGILLINLLLIPVWFVLFLLLSLFGIGLGGAILGG